MSFLKEFKEELSQAVNELVNIEDEEDLVSNDDKSKEKETVAKRRRNNRNKAGNDNLKTEEKTVDVKVDDETASNSEVLNVLFGKEAQDEAAEEIFSEISEEGFSDDMYLDNIDISDYMYADNSEEDNINDENKEIIRQLAENIKLKMSINDGDTQNDGEDIINEFRKEVMEEPVAYSKKEEKESRKAALRGGRYEDESEYIEDNITYEKNETAYASGESSEIAEGMTIEGNVNSDGDMTVHGRINGNVICAGKVVVYGTITGFVKGADVYTSNAKIEGDITSEGNVGIGSGSVVIGDVYGTSAVVAGAVKGDIDIKGTVAIDGTAVIQGNIRSKSVQINGGAAIEGMISQCYADIDYDELFDKTFERKE